MYGAVLECQVRKVRQCAQDLCVSCLNRPKDFSWCEDPGSVSWLKLEKSKGLMSYNCFKRQSCWCIWSLSYCSLLLFCSELEKKSENNEIINACLFNTEWNRCWNTWNWKWSRKETKLEKLQIERLMNLLLLSSQGSNLVCRMVGVSYFYQEVVSNSDKRIGNKISVFLVAVFHNTCL